MSEILFNTKFLQLKNENGWTYAHRPNAKNIVIIVPIIKGEEILFLKTRRPPLIAEGVSKFNIELPAGLVGDEIENEDVLEAAKKELLEETGMVAEKFTVLSENLSSTGGLTSESSTVILAEISNDAIINSPQSDGGVIVERIRIKIGDIKKWLQMQEEDGCSIGAQTLAGLFLCLWDNKKN